MITGKKADAVILGGGIIGITLALELQSQGRQVLVLEQGGVGLGCSFGNAGWITPCFAMPLPQPGLFWKSISWLFNPESPLHIQPRASLLLARWMTSFLASMNEKKMRRSIAALTDLSDYSLKFYQRLAKHENSFGFEQKGLLMVSATDDGLRSGELELRLMRERGIPGEVLTRDQVLDFEASLKPVVKGGFYFPSEGHCEPLATVQRIRDEFLSRGGRIEEKIEAFDFNTDGRKITHVRTTRGLVETPLLVLSAGTWSRALARRLGISLPLMGGKGYSFIVDSFTVKPRVPIMVIERKLAVTPRQNSVRIAGTLELVDQDFSISPRRAQALLRSADEYLIMGGPKEPGEVWRGLRPCTPDGVPLIGFSGLWENLFYNVGHQMLGLQSAPGSAHLAGQMILGQQPFTDPEPFRPQRYE